VSEAVHTGTRRERTWNAGRTENNRREKGMAAISVLEPRAEGPQAAPGNHPPAEEVLWEPRILAGDPDDDGSEPHICRGID
jgi:hypothetical protein